MQPNFPPPTNTGVPVASPSSILMSTRSTPNPGKPLVSASTARAPLPDSKPKSMRRQIMKIHGMSRASDGEFLYAVSFAKAKSFHYMTHREMVENYPNYLIGFYERNLQLGDVPDVDALVRADLAKEAAKKATE